MSSHCEPGGRWFFWLPVVSNVNRDGVLRACEALGVCSCMLPSRQAERADDPNKELERPPPRDQVALSLLSKDGQAYVRTMDRSSRFTNNNP